jgi:hypothetical protein
MGQAVILPEKTVILGMFCEWEMSIPKIAAYLLHYFAF